MLSEEDEDGGRRTGAMSRSSRIRQSTALRKISASRPSKISDSDPSMIMFEYSSMDLHETDEEKEAEVLKDDVADLFNDIVPEKDDQGDDI